jgi:hypothetical protein
LTNIYKFTITLLITRAEQKYLPLENEVHCANFKDMVLVLSENLKMIHPFDEYAKCKNAINILIAKSNSMAAYKFGNVE